MAQFYITSTKNSQGLPIAIRKDCRLADRSGSVGCTPPGCGGGEVVAVATEEPLDREPPDLLLGLFEFFTGKSTPLSLAELPPLLGGGGAVVGATQTLECSEPLLLPPTNT